MRPPGAALGVPRMRHAGTDAPALHDGALPALCFVRDQIVPPAALKLMHSCCGFNKRFYVKNRRE